MAPRRLLSVALACLLATAACGGGGDDAGSGATDSTIGGVGGVPPATAQDTASTDQVTLTLPSSLGTLPGGEEVTVPETLIGERVLGNRLLVIGDSITAGTATRYGGEMCATLVPRGWAVEVEAESGRFVEFGDRVLDAVLDEGWDAAVVFLGTNYNGDELGYEVDLAGILDRLAPRPVILLTTTMFRPMQAEVNAAIGRQVAARDNVEVIDWSSLSQVDGVLSGDGIHPTDAGRQLYVDALALLLGSPPVASPATDGQCLPSEFTDDSAVPGAPGGPGGMTTVPGGGSSGSSSGGGTPTTGAVVTAAPTTAPPTAPPTPAPTEPPTPAPTEAPPTAPPTAAPTTAPPVVTTPTTPAPTLPVTTPAPTVPETTTPPPVGAPPDTGG